MAPFTRLCALATLLGCIHPRNAQPIEVQHNCDLESGLCGWKMYNRNDSRQVGVVRPSDVSAPRLGPRRDANPGTESGHYYYFYYPNNYETYTLEFPNYQYICDLSFAYAVDGATTFRLSRWNFDQIDINTTLAAGAPNITGPWSRAHHHFTLPALNATYPLYFEQLLVDMGEAPPTNEEIFLALDDINITFCLPCHFDSLSAEGNMVLDAPDRIPIQVAALIRTNISANSSICPNATFVYTIEAVSPVLLAPIFSLDPYTGVLTVDARGPFLDGNGTAGNITFSVYIQGSNYTNLSPPFKVNRTAQFNQDPVISLMSPPTINITVGVPLYFSIRATSPLDYTVPLTYSLMSSQPSTLSDYVTVEPRLGDVVTAISVQQLPAVLSSPPAQRTLTFNVVNQFGANIVRTVQWQFAPSPPLFMQQNYSFFVQPISGVVPLGSLNVVDPHQRQLQLPQLTFSDPSDSPLFQLVCAGSFDCTLLWRQSASNQYKSNYSFGVLTYPASNPSLTASANIFVGLYPINAYIPVVTPQSMAVNTVDNAPAATVLSIFTAQDNDTGPAGNVTFALGDGNFGGFFNISPSGVLRVARSPLYPTTYRIIVLAVDGGTPPRVGRSYVSITVIATQSVDCSNANYYSSPVIALPNVVNLYAMNGRNLTLTCPVPPSTLPVVLTRWSVLPLPSGNQPNYRTDGSSLVLLSASDNDTGVYSCNVTNQCGSDVRGFILSIVDIPNAPAQFGSTGSATPHNVTVSWVYIPSPDSFHLTPVDYFMVELKMMAEASFRVVARVVSHTTITTTIPTFYTTTITGMTPYSSYNIRVVAVNSVGSKPSKVIIISTPPSVPQLSYLNVTALDNQSLLIAWQLAYNGGYPMTSLSITVEALDSSPVPVRMVGRPAPVTYSLSVNTSHYLTASFPQGWVYRVTAYVQNKIGISNLAAKAFVGTSYNIVCSYEGHSCPWTSLDGQRTTAGTGGSLLPRVDGDGYVNGHYWSLQASNPLTQWTVLQYPSAGWLCGFSFDYALRGSSHLTLQATSGEVLWSGVQDTSEAGINWSHISVPDMWIVPDASRRGLQFIVNSVDNQSTVALDNIMLTFCAPCSMDQLQITRLTLSSDHVVEDSISISPQNITVYLRTESNISLQTTVNSQCSAAILEYSISGVDPLCVAPSFTVPDTRYGIVHVGVISPEDVSPGTRGLLKVTVYAVGSDFNGTAITQHANLGLVLDELTGGCANTSYCDFSLGPCEWTPGPNVTTTEDSSPQMAGYYIQGYASRLNQVILSTAIGDDYCGISFNYMLTKSDMFITVQGLGVVWSTTGPHSSPTWAFQSVAIDLTSVGVWRGRILSFEVYGNSSVPMGSPFGLDNVTLVPCTDCAARECHCISCVPGSYFSIRQDKCIPCPLGYYCPESLDLPQPCPEGTYNPVTMVTSSSGCLSCPDDHYSFSGQSACKGCPNGFSCSDPANPVVVASTAAGMIAAVVSAVIFAALLVVGVVLCLYCFYCIRKSRLERMKERAKYLNSRWNTQTTEQSTVANTPNVEGQKKKTIDQMAVHDNVIVYSNVLYEGDDASMSSIPVAALHSTPALPQIKQNDGTGGEEEDPDEVDLIQFGELRGWGQQKR